MPYPDLTPIMAELQSRRVQASAAHRIVLDKWLQQLSQVQHEMRKLERLDLFASVVGDVRDSKSTPRGTPNEDTQ